MNAIRNILVIVDPTAAQHPAVLKGALLAKKLGSRLNLYACETKAARQVRVAARAASSIADALEALASPLRRSGLEVTTERECAEPLYAALVDKTKRCSADLVVKDTHHHSVIRRTFLTNTDWHLICECPVPLLLTKQNAWPAAPRIFAAVDPGHANDKPAILDNCILDCASRFAKALSAELHVLHAYITIELLSAAASEVQPMETSSPAEELASEEQQKRAQLAELTTEYGVAPARVHLEFGGAAEVIPRIAADQRADIVAMGAVSRSGLRRVFIGSTAEDVLESLPCDALIVKSPDFAAILPF